MLHESDKTPDDQKLKELILFIADRSSNDTLFGSIKLNKLLFFSDFIAYEKNGASITGHVYQRLPKGPAPRQMKPILDQMVDSRILAIKEREFHGRKQKRPIALRAPNLKIFSAEEIAVVTDVINSLRHKNAKGISTLSHEFPGWKLAKERESIPYSVALVQFKKPTKKDMQKARDLGDVLSKLRKDADGSD